MQLFSGRPIKITFVGQDPSNKTTIFVDTSRWWIVRLLGGYVCWTAVDEPIQITPTRRHATRFSSARLAFRYLRAMSEARHRSDAVCVRVTKKGGG